MGHYEALMRKRRSFRSFDGQRITDEHLSALSDMMEKAENPYGLKLCFALLNAKEQKLSCPVVVGTDLYLGAKMKAHEFMNEAIGYSLEKLMLDALSLGIGSVWIGGTMDRAAFEKSMCLAPDEIMPVVTPLGYPAKKMSLRETMIRKGIRADSREPFEKLFFRNDFSEPLTDKTAGKLYLPLEMVRLAPSAVNKQPWRCIVNGNKVHFYLKRSMGAKSAAIDMQKIDMGIALCHFALAAEELSLKPSFSVLPEMETEGMEYIASYTLKG